ncbi:MAG TPA: D-alanyl-D-alanine carboxypeptidase family protein [Thermodesulfovibrionales bacterium]|nr:D-alanyl-D-alanine carboxypeptidase family protein [Thermodesulfovibrionales bacterium]
MKKEFYVHPPRRTKFKMSERKALVIVLFLFTAVCGLLSDTVYADEIRSRAAIVMEASTGRILYGKNPNLPLPPASTTKLMTAMVVLDRIPLGSAVVISEGAATISRIRAFRAGETVTVETLLNAALIKSANDAAFALAEAVAGTEEKFVELMNQKVIALGMEDTRFINATGLPGYGQHTTAYDLARMLRHALRYPLIKEIINTKASRISTEEGRAIFIRNSNRLLWEDESVLGGKTGYTREAKHCLVCASGQGNETVIAAILGAPSREKLWRESEALLEKGYKILQGTEEPVMHFTRADYKTSVQPASYSERISEVKEVPHKKTHKKMAKKKTKSAKSGRYTKKYKSDHAYEDGKQSGGDKG